MVYCAIIGGLSIIGSIERGRKTGEDVSGGGQNDLPRGNAPTGNAEAPPYRLRLERYNCMETFVLQEQIANKVGKR